MTDNRRQQVSTVAQFTLAISVIGLTITIGVGIWHIGAIYGTVSNEHQQIFRELRQLGERQCR